MLYTCVSLHRVLLIVMRLKYKLRDTVLVEIMKYAVIWVARLCSGYAARLPCVRSEFESGALSAQKLRRKLFCYSPFHHKKAKSKKVALVLGEAKIVKWSFSRNSINFRGFPVVKVIIGFLSFIMLRIPLKVLQNSARLRNDAISLKRNNKQLLQRQNEALNLATFLIGKTGNVVHSRTITELSRAFRCSELVHPSS